MKTKKFLLLALTALCSLGVWGAYTSEWDGWAQKEQLPAANTPSTKNDITLESSIAPSTGWLWGTLCNAYNPENVEGFHIDITTTDAANIEFSDVMIEIRYDASVPNTVYIQFYTTPSIDDAKKNGDPVVLNADGQNYLGDWKQVPSGSRSARIYRTATSYGPWFYGFHITTQTASTVFHKVHYVAGEGTGTMADDSIGENKSFKLPKPSGLSYAGHRFTKWSDGNNLYAVGDNYQMGTSDLTFTAQWEELVVPTVTGLQVKDAENEVVPLVWAIPGICDLSNPVKPLAANNGNPTYNYDAATDVATATGYVPQWDQYGMAFNIGSVANVESVSFDYTGTMDGNISLWSGACDANYAYWEFNKTVTPTSSWKSTSSMPNKKYWDEGDVANPLSGSVSQVAIYANSGSGDHDNQVFSVKNVRYHVQDAVDVAKVVVLRKAGSAISSISDADADTIYEGTKSKFTDSEAKVPGTTYHYSVYCVDADGNISAAASTSYEYIASQTYTVTYAKGAEDVTGTLPTEPDHVAGAKFNLAAGTGLARKGYVFAGWNDGASTLQAGAEYTMPAAAVTLTAQWSELVVPAVTGVQVKSPDDNIVPLVWAIPGICDLSNPVEPLASSSGNPTYVYDAANDVATATGKAIKWEQYGIAFNIGAVTNIESVSFDYKGQENSDINIWAGTCDNFYAYWESGKTNSISTDFQSVSVKPNMKYWAEGSVDNPLASAMPQIAIFANAGSADYEGHSISVKNVRYHVQDAVDIKEVVVMRKEGSAPASLTDGTEIYRGTKSTFTDESEKTAGKTYYYTVFALANDDTPSLGASTSYTYIIKEPHTVTYAKGGEDVTGNVPTEDSHKEGQVFTMAAAGDLALAGYTFNGWSIGNEAYMPGEEYTMPDSAVVFTAIWKDLPAIPGTLMPATDICAKSDNATINGNGELELDFNSQYAPSAWADFKVKAANAGTYTFTFNGYNSNNTSHQMTIEVFDANDVSLGVIAEEKTGGMPTQITVGSMELEAGTYRLRVTDPVEWAQFIVQNVTVTYKAPVVYDLPATLSAADAVLAGSEWSYDDGWIKRANVSPTDGSATWKANVTKAGEYKVSMNISSDNGFHLYVTAYDSLSQSAGQVSATSGSGVTELGSITFSATGKYNIVVTNTTAWSHSWFKDLKFEFVAPVPSASFATTMKDIKEGEHFTQTVTTESTGDVTYESGNTAVATVDATTGEVIGMAVGTTSITANIAATADFQATSVSYTISVVAAPVVGRKYYIDPGSDKLYDVIQNALENDTVIFRDGEYTEAYSRTFTTMITLMADEGAHPVINTVSYLKANKGITIDGIDVNSTNANYAIYLNGASTDDMIFRNATITSTGNYAVYANTDMNRLIVDNCVLTAANNFAINMSKLANLVSVTNTTFLNCPVNGGIFLVGSTAMQVLIDHCTFYNCGLNNYFIIHAGGFNSTNMTVNNCVLYNPTAGAQSGIVGQWGNNATVKNCLVNNCGTNATQNTNNTNLYTEDPLLVVADGKYEYQAGSPIIGAATDGSNLGDPRWKMQQIIISDQATDNSVLTDNEGKTINVKLERSLTGGMFNTICLPFALSAEQIAASDWKDAEIIELVNTTLENQTLYLEFSEVDAIEAGKGYLIAPVNDVENPSFDAVTITKTEATTQKIGSVDVLPSFIITTIPASTANLFLYSNNTLYYAGAATQMDGLRLYYHINEATSLAPARMRMYNRGAATEIIQIDTITAINGKFIKDGALYIIKDGVMYNAQGQIVK